MSKTMRNFALVAAVALGFPFVVSCTNHSGTENKSGTEASQQAAGNEATASGHSTLTVQGLCGMCKKRIEETAKSVAGVSFAQWDGKTKLLQLDFDSDATSLNAISLVVAAAGHDTEKHQADDAVYNAFPGCCKYRK
ncbi:MAG: cation transporter [Planctomycetaceae bacterium]|jgi:Cu(I)/Ag(I) efflux system membrane fusion protein|nr:cation transporter [Planctomycetaceae bacterium]